MDFAVEYVELLRRMASGLKWIILFLCQKEESPLWKIYKPCVSVVTKVKEIKCEIYLSFVIYKEHGEQRVIEHIFRYLSK